MRPAVLTAVRLARALAAFLALASLVVLVPLVLLRWGRSPLQTGESIGDFLAGPLDDHALLGVITIGLWVAWAAFVACVVLELVAAGRARLSGGAVVVPQVRGVSTFQVTAHRLVASLLMFGATSPLVAVGDGSVAASPVLLDMPPADGVIELATAPTHSAIPEAVGEPAPTAVADGGVTLTVTAGDSAWDLAEAHLGDGMSWRELFDLNRSRPQPDGRVWTDPEVLLPGWQIVLPEQDLPTASGSGQVIVVAPGDSAWDLAEAHLGDGMRWRELFDLNKGRAQPDGHGWNDPEVLQPGWQLELPVGHDVAGATTDGSVGDHGPSASHGSEAPSDAASSASPERTPPTTRPPDIGSSPLPPSTTAPRPGPEADTDATEAPAIDEDDVDASSRASDDDRRDGAGEAPADDDSTAPAPVLGAAGTLLAVALLRAWRRKRTRRSMRRPLGATPSPRATEAKPVAKELLLAEGHVDPDRVDTALAALAASLRPRSRRACAQPRLVQVTGGQVEILLDRAEPAAPAPWRTEGSGLVWVLDADAELPAADGPSLLPALATVGMDDASMLLDLEAFGVVALLGDPDACRGMATSFVTELSARNEGAVGIQIVGLDLGADLRGLDGVRVVDVWGDTDTEPIAGSARLLDAGRWPHTFAARASGRVFDGWSPTVWVTTHSDDPEYQAAVDAVAARPGTGSALVVVGDDPGCGLRIRLASNGRFTIPELGLTGRTQQLDAAVADHVVDLLADADSPEDVNDPCGGVAAGSNGNGERDDEDADSRPSVDDSSTVAEYHACTGVLDGMGNGHRGPYSDPSYRVLVRVCGELRVEGSENPLRQRETAIATYVALHGEAHIDQLRDAVWAGADVSRKRVQNVISKLRQDVGKAIRHVGDGRLAQGPGLITDLELIRRRLAFASHQTAEARATTLHEALQLVTGPVCTYPSTAARCWTWIDLEQWIPHTESIVGRLACDLAGLYLRLKDADSATWAARRGIEISGQREELVLLLVHAYELSGNQPAARAALESYERYATEYDIDEHSEAMVEALRRHLPARHH